MPTRRYLRRIRVTVGDVAVNGEEVKIENLYVRFRIRSEATSTPAEGTVDIYNLNESNETRIRPRGRRVRIETGYGDSELSLLFDGEVRRVERQRVELDRISRIHVSGKGTVPEDEAPPRAIFMKTYIGIVSIRTIVADGIAALGLQAGPLDLIPEDAFTQEANWGYNGDARRMITFRLEPFGLNWYVENGVVYITRYRQTQDDRPEGVTISERTGMIGTPTVTDDGIRVRTLLDPRLSLDSRITVESTVLGSAASGDAANLRATELAGGTFKVVELTHAGDNRGGQFDTLIEGRPID